MAEWFAHGGLRPIFRWTLLPLAGVLLAMGSGVLGLQASTDAVVPPGAAIAVERRAIRAEGRVETYPGSDITLGSELAAGVEMIAGEGVAVEAGNVVARLGADEIRAQLRDAKARVVEVRAEHDFDVIQLGRLQILLRQNACSHAEFDKASFDLKASDARLDRALATVDRYESILRKTEIRSPIRAVVAHRFVEVGERVEAGTQVIRIVDASRLRIEAEIDEFDVGKLVVGAPVLVRAEGYDVPPWTARLEQIPSVVEGRQLRPQDPARPVDTRVVRAKIALLQVVPLKIGQRVEVEIGED